MPIGQDDIFMLLQSGHFGSQAIASSYEIAGKVVRGMIQFDMTVRLQTRTARF
jgi:hypothetical protein